MHLFRIAGLLCCLASSLCCYAATVPSSPDQAPSPPTPSESSPALSTGELNACLRLNVISADETMTIAELRQACNLLKRQQPENATGTTVTVEETTVGNPEKAEPLLRDRLTMEALNRSNRFLLTPHKRNFLLPVAYNNHPNTAPYIDANDSLAELDYTEAELQVSIKILMRENIFGNNGHLYLGYTSHSFWQVYSDTDSAPFRETDHEPEFILSFNNNWEIGGFRNALNEIIINHQSNGLGGLLSRSWNRVMLNSVFEHDNFVLALKPWYRLPEDAQEYPGDPHGDDNPDINHYLGKFEFSAAYQRKQNIFSLMLRNNLKADNKGAAELGWSFPISSNLRGHFKYFNGYGYSLIDYNADQQVFALGVIFTDLF
jgi:phospholipase A1